MIVVQCVDGAPITGVQASSARPGTGRDAGSSFVETLVAIVLLGTVVIGLLTATRAQISASRTSRDAAQIESALLAAAERVERAPRDDYTCDLSSPVYAAAQLELGVSAAEAPMYALLSYEHLTATGWAAGACPGTPPAYQPSLVQRIEITMISPDSGLTRKLEVLKGDV